MFKTESCVMNLIYQYLILETYCDVVLHFFALSTIDFFYRLKRFRR